MLVVVVVIKSHVWLFATPCQAPLLMGFPRQEYCRSGLPFPSPGDIPNPGIKSWSPAFRADTLPSEPPGNPNYEDISFKINFIHSVSQLGIR